MKLTPDILLRAYAAGLFPMAESRDDPELFWIDPDDRGILPLDRVHIPKRLRRTLRQGRFEVRIDTAFRQVLAGCAEPGAGRDETWINPEIRRLYGLLFDLGHAHSVESWQDGRLVGGLYGVSLGGAFFGESMFSRVTDASKVALAYLVAGLKMGGFVLLDTQFVTDHLQRFGAIEIPRKEYRQRLDAALPIKAEFPKAVSQDEMIAHVGL